MRWNQDKFTMSSHIGRVNSSISDFISVLCQLFGSQMPAKITYLGGSWGLSESLYTVDQYVTTTVSTRGQSALCKCPSLTCAAFWASSFLILAFSMLSCASLFFLSPSILFLSPSCLCFSISANFPFTLPEEDTRLQSVSQNTLFPETFLCVSYL